tara:strand:+ start:145 stop:624 length:480 start_codon:yes stop_codon:yes gene_type:complete
VEVKSERRVHEPSSSSDSPSPEVIKVVPGSSSILEEELRAPEERFRRAQAAGRVEVLAESTCALATGMEEDKPRKKKPAAVKVKSELATTASATRHQPPPPPLLVVVAAEPPPPPPAGVVLLQKRPSAEDLAEVAGLYEQGYLTTEEFRTAKGKIIAKM